MSVGVKRRARRAAATALLHSPPSLVARVLRAGAEPAGVPYARFDREDGPPVELLTSYRDVVKSTWRVFWWPTQALFRVRSRQGLPSHAEEIARAIESARALPVPLVEVADALVESVGAVLRETSQFDAELERNVLEVPPDDAEVKAISDGYRATAEAVLASLRPHGFETSSARVLDVGCGSGYAAFAFAARGAREVVGVDLDPDRYVRPTERELIRDELGGGDVRLEAGDAEALQYESDSFDLVYSFTAVEHFGDAAAAFREVARVLRPGGLSYHGVDPWLGPRGGHALCTLDFPWGHARVSRADFDRYLSEHRPYEREDALAFYDTGFQRPRLTQAETLEAVRAAGLEVLRSVPTPLALRDPHRALYDRDLLADVRQRLPGAEPVDLLTRFSTLILRRPR